MGETLIYEELRTLRRERDLSRSELSRLTVRPGYKGVPEKTIQALETHPGRVPEADIIEALSEALDVEATRFYEYPIAVARRTAKEAATPRAGAGAPAADHLAKPAPRPTHAGRRRSA